MVTQRENGKKVKVFLICLLAVCLLSPVLFTGVKAQSGGVTVGYWPLDKVQASGYNTITPDASSVNAGIIAGTPEPTLVEGKFDKAMQFNGDNFVYVPIKFVVGFPPTPQPIYVPISTNLDVQKYIQIDAWINVPGYKNATYNNIVIKCTHFDQACAWQNATRVLGLTLRAGTPESGEQYVEGALSGFVLTDNGFNEIATTEPVPLNQWVSVEFTRTATGMHLYIDGQEQGINVLHGTQNPQGNIINGTEYYFGHDGLATLDDVRITDLFPPDPNEDAFDIGPNIMIAIIVVSVIFAVAWLLRRGIQLWIIRPKI